MSERLDQYVNGVFAPYDGIKSVAELKEDLLADLQERFRELKAEGKDDQTAFEMTIDSIGDIEQTVHEVANVSRSLQRQVLINFSASNLPQSDFAGVVPRGGKFTGSALRGSNFAGADLTGSSFYGSDVRDANFDGANLTDCNLSAIDLGNSSFRKSVLVRTNFSQTGMTGTKFVDVRLIEVKMTQTDLRKTIFEKCSFLGVDFGQSDLSGLALDGQSFFGVKFEMGGLYNVSFRGATLREVSFHASYSLFNRQYRAFKTIRFEGASMDKLTYAALKGLEADLSKVTVI